jgi:hypothetical protein
MKKMIYVVDKKKSALHTAASARVTITGGKILIANEFRSPIELLESIYDYRGYKQAPAAQALRHHHLILILINPHHL